MKKSDREKILGTPDGTWLWCLHCERAYKSGEYREIDGLQMCPYDECNGDTIGDGWPWKRVRGASREYPEEPERGKVYPLYPKEAKEA